MRLYSISLSTPFDQNLWLTWLASIIRRNCGIFWGKPTKSIQTVGSTIWRTSSPSLLWARRHDSNNTSTRLGAQLSAIGVTIAYFDLVQIVIKNVPNSCDHFLQHYTSARKYPPLNEWQTNLMLEESRRAVKAKVKDNRHNGSNGALYFRNNRSNSMHNPTSLLGRASSYNTNFQT